MAKYNPSKIEKKWQDYWEKKKTFFARDFSKKPKKYVLAEFPYPSGKGLHMGHLRPYVAADVYARYYRMRGYEVMFPIGWDAFGLPAENFAIRNKIQPSVSTAKNVKNAKKQMLSWGLSFDWSREINTTDPEYYKWTQWIFLQLFRKGLAYESTGIINWCPKDKTGLANEEVIDGKCERCGTKVEKKELKQWYLRITAYAEKLLEGLKYLDKWPKPVKLQQKNWIGRKEGINITYNIKLDYNYVLLHGWKGSPNGIFFSWLRTELDKKNIEYTVPKLPNILEPTEEEQVNYVLKTCKFNKNTILFGHSLGAVVAMKALIKHGKPIAGLVLAGTAIDPEFVKQKKIKGNEERPFWKTFSWDIDYEKIKRFTNFRTVLSDLNERKARVQYLRYLSEKLKAKLVEDYANECHFTNGKEPLILKNLIFQVTCFTTRPDTNFGATFVALGPEHSLLKSQKILNFSDKVWKDILSYKDRVAKETEAERLAEGKKKTGVFTGLYCVNNLNNYKMPLYVADYVLGDVGTGAVVGVPGHDKRDFEFARIFKLPVKRVVQKDQKDVGKIDSLDKVQEEEGLMVNSEFLNGLDIHKATQKMMDFMEAQGYGKRVVTYKLRDWVFSRQRYWGEPIPIIHCEDCGAVAVPEKDLPVILPKVKDYEPTGTGQSPLANMKSWLKTKCPNCGKLAWRETNTMPQWAGSSWYWLRYADPKNKKELAAKKKLKYWQPVDVYFGGMEHTTLHLLYSRFWNLFLYDGHYITVKEPYVQRKPHGIVLAGNGEKMSKSKGNAIDPQTIVKEYGADTLRMYELFLGPHETQVSWNDQGIIGVKRFLDRAWAWVMKCSEPIDGQFGKADKSARYKVDNIINRSLHRLIKKVTEDIENFRFNTAISAFMEFLNEVKDEKVDLLSVQKFLKILYPFAPHIAEELNQTLKGKKSLQLEPWPKFDSNKIMDKQVEIVVQINGKVRGRLNIAADSSEDQVKKEALKIGAVKKALLQESIKRVIFVENRLINLVI